MTDQSSSGYHVVLRLRPEAVTWLDAARLAHNAPPGVRALLSGRTRVELSADEAGEAVRWSSELPGWELPDGTALEKYDLDASSA